MTATAPIHSQQWSLACHRNISFCYYFFFFKKKQLRNPHWDIFKMHANSCLENTSGFCSCSASCDNRDVSKTSAAGSIRHRLLELRARPKPAWRYVAIPGPGGSLLLFAFMLRNKEKSHSLTNQLALRLLQWSLCVRFVFHWVLSRRRSWSCWGWAFHLYKV